MSRTPTAFEQAILEYTNQARMNPGGEFDVAIADASTGASHQSNITSALRYFGVDIEAYRTQMEAYEAVAPLAWNGALATAATTHSQLMIDTDTQSHNLPGEAGLGARITAAGYTGWSTVGENIFAYTDDPLYGHVGFMVDWGYDSTDIVDGVLRPDWQTNGDGIQDPAGHRIAIMSERYTDIGIGVLEENDTSTSVGPYVLTQNLGAQHGTQAPKLLGVFIDDRDNDDFYDIGEGLGGITVTATGTGGTFTTTTWDAGGYQMDVAAGTYTVTFEGTAAQGIASYNVTVGRENTKLDGEAADFVTQDPPPDTGGNTGGNTADITGTQGADTLLGSGTAAQSLSGLAGSDVVLGDGVDVTYFSDVSAQVFRLYQATLGRTPDSTGHTAWTGRIAVEGQAAVDVASGFMGSPEFLASFGGLSNTDFVELLYTNVLGRAADAGGLARWTGDLAGGVSRAEVVLGFSDSGEFINTTAAAATAATDATSAAAWGDDVYRLYQATLDRAPDLTGFTNWSARLADGTTYEQVANGFVASAEFTATYQDLDNTAFVELLYNNVLDRAADAGGLARWTGDLASGTTRAQVVEGFAQSGEFIARTAEDLTDWIRAQGTDDTINGGAGNDVLAGGALSDVFVFDRTSGADTVLDLEAWDTLDLTAFNFASDAAARAAFSQQGADVVFSGGAGVTTTFVQTDLSILTDDLILV